MRITVLSALAFLVCLSGAAAQTIPVQDLVSAYQCSTGLPGSVSIYSVPLGHSFLLTDLIVTSRIGGVAVLYDRVGELRESGTTRHKYMISGRVPGSSSTQACWDYVFAFRSPIVFTEGNSVEFSVDGNTPNLEWCVSISGYLVENTVTGMNDSPQASPLGRLSCAPNPTTGLSRLEFTIERPGDALLEVFDVAGKRVTTLVDHALTSGSHEIAWDGRDSKGKSVPSGVYFPRLTMNGRSSSSRLVVLK